MLHFRLKPLTAEQLAQHLCLICQQEGIHATKAGLLALGEVSKGSGREAINLLGMLALMNISVTLIQSISMQRERLKPAFLRSILSTFPIVYYKGGWTKFITGKARRQTTGK